MAKHTPGQLCPSERTVHRVQGSHPLALSGQRSTLRPARLGLLAQVRDGLEPGGGNCALLRSGTAVGNRYGTPASSRPPHASSALAGPAFQPDAAGNTVRAAPASDHGRSRRLRIAGADRFLVAAPTQAVGLRRRRPQTSGRAGRVVRPLRSVRSLCRSSRNGRALRYAACTVEANCPAGGASVRSVPYARRRVEFARPEYLGPVENRFPVGAGIEFVRQRRTVDCPGAHCFHPGLHCQSVPQSKNKHRPQENRP